MDNDENDNNHNNVANQDQATEQMGPLDQGGERQTAEASSDSSPAKNHANQNDGEPCTPEKVHRIPKDDSFKTCKATLPTPATRRQLRATPARNSILSGGKPYKEVNSSGRKFNSRRKAASKRNGANESRDQHNESADSNETFVRHERDLLYDPDSLDLEASPHKRRQPLELNDGIDRPDISGLASSRKKLSPIMKLRQQQQQLEQQKPKPKPQEPKQQEPTKRMSMQAPKPKPTPMPTSTPMPFAMPKANPKPMPKPNPFHFTRYMSSTAKKPQQQKQLQQKQEQPMFKKPSSIISNFSVASSRRCLSQWNTPRLTRAQSFKSTAELEREYFSSLRSRS